MAMHRETALVSSLTETHWQPRQSASQRAERQWWMRACTARLVELRPTDSPARLAGIAAELWEDVGAFDPIIAAEIEHESSDSAH